MASSKKKKRSNLFDENNDIEGQVQKSAHIRVNDIPDIDKFVLNLTSVKIDDFIKDIIKLINGVENALNIEQTLKQHYTVITKHTELDKINLCHLLRLTDENNIFNKFEVINKNDLHSSSYFSLIGTFLIIIISHRKITTEDVCFFSTILQDDIINKTILDWPILKDFIELFRTILHVEFVKNIYYELINDEIESTNTLLADHFKDIIDHTIEEIIEKRGLAFANLSTCYAAVTCFNRTIIINKNIVMLELIDDAKNLKDNSIMFGALLLIMLHEFLHALHRTIKNHAFNPFNEQRSSRKIASDYNMETTDSDTQLDDRLFGIVCETVGYLDGKFLLNSQNWTNYNHQEFKENFNDTRTRDLAENKKHNRWILRRQSHKTNDDTNTDDTKTASIPMPTTFRNRWKIPQCALASPLFNIEQ
ncbi:unnamed protein product [Rotaria sp. Silwood2]|nr:unnamed protein product [Rotaria sp. Silwood2]